MIGGSTQPTRNSEFPSDFTLQFQSDSLLFYPEPNGHGHQAQAWLDPNEQAHDKYRFILFRSISLDSLKEDEVSSFVHPDQEIEYDLIGYVVGFLALRKAGGKLLKNKLEVEVEAAPGKLEYLLKKWADDNDRDRKEISDIIWKKAVFGHSIYSRLKFEFALDVQVIVHDTRIEPMKGFRCIRRGNKNINLYFDATRFGENVDLRPLHAHTPDNVIMSRQARLLDSMPLQSKSFGNTLPKKFYESFLLHLEDHQKHSVRWMQLLEEEYFEKATIPKDWWTDTYELAKLPSHPSKLVNVYRGTVLDSFPSAPSYFSRGGILASGPGSGKTIVALSLIASRPVPTLNMIRSRIPFEKERSEMLASRATLIVVPGHLVDHWVDEIKKAFRKENLVVREITSKEDFLAVSWRDIIYADIVVLSMTFYFGKSNGYGNFINDIRSANDQIAIMRELIASSDAERLRIKGTVLFLGLYFHRVIVDEFYENQDERLLHLKGDFLWALSSRGLWKKDDIEFAAKFVDPFTNFFFKADNFTERLVRHISFKKNFINSLPIDLVLPDVHEEIIPIRWSYDTYQVLQPIGNAFQSTVNEKSVQVLDAKEAKSLLLMSLDNEIHEMIQVVAMDLSKISPDLQRRFQGVDLYYRQEGASVYIKEVVAACIADEIKALIPGPILVEGLRKMEKMNIIKSIKDRFCSSTRIRDLEREQQDLSAFIESKSFKVLWSKEHVKSRLIKVMDGILAEKEEIECPCCRDAVHAKNCPLVITDCFHVYDIECFEKMCKKTRECACCRSRVSLKRSTIFTINGERVHPVDLEMYAFPENIPNTIITVVQELRSIVASQKNAKIVIFAHDEKVAPAVASVIPLLGLNTVRLTKKQDESRESIWHFKKGAAQVMVILAGVDICGLDLHIATHLLIVENANDLNPDLDKHIISRIHRMGLKRPLVLMRFRER